MASTLLDQEYAYHFQDGKVSKVNWDNNLAVDAGYPKLISNQFKGLPSTINAAVNHPTNPSSHSEISKSFSFNHLLKQ